MSRKVALFAFNGKPMYFVHALLNALAMKDRELSNHQNPFSNLYIMAKPAGIIDCVCEACAIKTGVYESADLKNSICAVKYSQIHGRRV
mgnify:CR=1 FL=1